MNREGPVSLKKIHVTGVVQGVGFRPFVHQLAHAHGLNGWVLNTSAGVDIEVEGPAAVLTRFLQELQTEAPPLARIESIKATDHPPDGYEQFEIRRSVAEEGKYQLISPDIALCGDCLGELLDPQDRRYRYPFTNCTNCGPRFTIIEDIPYDRPLTTMRDFIMCADCQEEYDNPLDRRFHAQPNACPVCGPVLSLTDGEGARIATNDEISTVVRLLREGKILAIKGLGGFHLACDATNEEAIQRLRQRKQRPAKPMAVMMATMEDIEAHCSVSTEERELLSSPQCPIGLLSWKSDSTVSRLVAPGNRYLGAMLPYTPLHHVLLREIERPLVMTSGNISEEPIAIDNEEALHRLRGIADYFLLHNRDIYARYDDSVWMVVDGKPQPLRRSRGYAPFPIRLPFEARRVLACGTELKNTFCAMREEYAFLSQHIGDMENKETLHHFEASIELYRRLFRLDPEIVAYDLHPDYLATRYALALSPALPLVPVQHHHAHIVSCLVDNGVDGEVIGVALDGTGYGTDGQIWGGEFLLADYASFRRVGHLEYVPLPGGEAAIRSPYRMAIGHLYSSLGDEGLNAALPFLGQIEKVEKNIIRQQIDKGINTPLTSSCGRLFDAVSALLGFHGRATYEAQAAIELEMMATGTEDGTSYPFSIKEQHGTRVVLLSDLWQQILKELAAGVPPGVIAHRFHNTLAEIMVEMCRQIASDTSLSRVALSGGCFQNRLLLSKAMHALDEGGFEVLTHQEVPSNDGGVSLGQATIALFTDKLQS
ncbi:MAG: carbamoyltransferase HypF [Anaerolineae bacterium]|nr:carbamoyltransferase HypF [Anaerolineae bacterium]NIQ78148.1 carbamoyltransferase HypF [Anaerolineae bacterium]